MTKILFICNQNKNRNKTAERLFQGKFETQSAGLYTSKLVTSQQLNWADVVMIIEEAQRTELAKRFPKHYLQKRILPLDIPDKYSYDDPELVQLLKSRVKSSF